MDRRFVTLAWIAAACTYLLIVLGAVVRITGSGLGCGEHWPLCNGHLFPPLSDPPTVIEWSHRLFAALVSILVVGLAVYGVRSRELGVRARMAYVALALLIVQVLLGAITVKTGLTPLIVILHLGTAMLLLATLITAARGPWTLAPGSRLLLSLTFVTVLFGALTANLGATSACGGFPLCNGQIITSAGPLAAIHWTHRLLAYSLLGCVVWWVYRYPNHALGLLAIVLIQITIAATMVLLGFPGGLQAAHAAVGAAVWATAVLAALRPAATPAAAPSASPPDPRRPYTR
ncbi:MAG TPA: COX15/CtaA family protein [Gemmatimonadales bacterium]|nr:COX15/CtaA family protein [Gemmatimonadales bacterium]